MNSLSRKIKGKAIPIDERYLHVELKDGRIISTPMNWYPELEHATLAQLAKYRFICRGTGIKWPELDYHLSIEAMLAESRQEKAA